MQFLQGTTSCFGQLHIADGTLWVSTPATAVVLKDMGIQYDASSSWLLNNTFLFTGTVNAAFGGNSQPYVYAVSVAKTSPAKLYLTSQVNIAKRINFQSGLLDLNGLYIVLDETAILTNESETSHIYGSLAGGVTINATLNGPVNANPGNLGAMLTSPGSLGAVTITRGHVPMYVNFSGYGVARYFDIGAENTIPDNSTLRFYYLDAELNGLPKDSLGLWEASDATYSPLGFSSRNATDNYVEQRFTQFGRFTLYTVDSAVTVLPLESIALAGNWKDHLAQLNWNVISPYNVDHFDVQRKYSSEPGFTSIASVLPTLNTYTDSTITSAAGEVSYRIHQVGTGGQSAYSNIITLQAINQANFIHTIYPTIAVVNGVYIQVGNEPLLTTMHLQVFDSRGALVMSGTLPYQSQWLNISPLSKGIYRLLLQSGTNKYVGTFIK